MESDVAIYVVGSTEENEVLLYNVLLALRDSLHLLFKFVANLLTLHKTALLINVPGNPSTSER
jgi:hypothetical protein